ncbi:MAG TPA: hypothetical protein PKD86_06555 [Gemmatales bacterium]|nr:hypothetical protein [Gemmatales bacterium]HMP58998.1 hypothetical protein [Gemmatales bacterium]
MSTAEERDPFQDPPPPQPEAAAEAAVNPPPPGAEPPPGPPADPWAEMPGEPPAEAWSEGQEAPPPRSLPVEAEPNLAFAPEPLELVTHDRLAGAPVFATPWSSSAPPPRSSGAVSVFMGLLATVAFVAAGFYPLLELVTSPDAVSPQELPFKEDWIRIAIWVLAGSTAFFTFLRLFVCYWALALGTLLTSGAAFAFVFLVKPQGSAVSSLAPGLGLYLLAAGGAVLLLGAVAARAAQPPRYTY